jgi:thiol-disulfide isomerase/thioredoxin
LEGGVEPYFVKSLVLYGAALLAVSPNWTDHDSAQISGVDSSANVVLAQVPDDSPHDVVAAPTATRPILVFIHSTECPVCARVRPIMKRLETTYKGKAQFIFLDVTDDQAKEKARQIAKAAGFRAFFALYEDTYPCVGIFTAKKKCMKELFGYQTEDKYTSTLDKAMSAN